MDADDRLAHPCGCKCYQIISFDEFIIILSLQNITNSNGAGSFAVKHCMTAVPSFCYEKFVRESSDAAHTSSVVTCSTASHCQSKTQ